MNDYFLFFLIKVNCSGNKTTGWGPGWCGSVDWALAWEPEGHGFDPQSRAHAWVVGQVPSRGSARGNHTLMFLPLFLPPFPSLKIKSLKIQGGANVGLQLLVCETEFVLVLFTNDYIIFHTNNCRPTFAPLCIVWVIYIALNYVVDTSEKYKECTWTVKN